MITILVFVVLCVISLAPVVWLMSEMGPERAWSQITLYFVCASAILLFIAGYSFRMSKASYNMLQLTGVLSILMVIATGGSAVIRAGLYSHAWDERMAMLQEQSKKVSEVQDTIKLAPLPDSGWLHSAEISTDPEHFTNRHLRQYLEMDQPIVKSIPGTTTNGSP